MRAFRKDNSVLLRRKGLYYILIREVYVSGGYMKGRAIDEMEAGTRLSEWFEIHSSSSR